MDLLWTRTELLRDRLTAFRKSSVSTTTQQQSNTPPEELAASTILPSIKEQEEALKEAAKTLYDAATSSVFFYVSKLPCVSLSNAGSCCYIQRAYAWSRTNSGVSK